MTDLIAELKERLQPLRNFDVAHEELGTVNGFHEAQQELEAIITTLDGVLLRLGAFRNQISPVLVSDGIGAISVGIERTSQTIREIDEAVKQGVNVPDFPKRRRRLIEQMRSVRQEVERKLAPTDLALRIAELMELQAFARPEAVERSAQEAQQLLAQMRDAAAEVQKTLDNVQGKTAEKAVDVAAVGFETLKEKHRKAQAGWFVALCLSALVAAGAIIWAVFSSIETGSVPVVAAQLFRRLLLISAPLAVIRVCLTKYNTERNLHVLYHHRQSVLEQYRYFESAIGDDSEAKNSLRLAVAKFIFSDPNTGYVTTYNGPELTINPVFGAIESLSKGK